VTTSHHQLRIETTKHVETIDITDRVADALERSGIREGICLIAVPHTTAGVFVNENADPAVQRDLLALLTRLVPDEGDYRHAEGNAPGHIKAALVGTDVSLAIRDGRLALGQWQGVYLAEFDGPRRRHAIVTVVGERAG